MYWLEVRVTVDGEAAEAVAGILRPYAHNEGVVFEQLGDPNDSDPTALQPEVAVKAYLPGDRDSEEKRRRISEALYHMNRLYPVSEPEFRVLQDEDWASAWKKNYRPFRVGRHLWIQPSWHEQAPPEEGRTIVTLDPGMAFGTGLHPSTRLCLQELENEMAPAIRILDAGTGSGILAIAGARLGAAGVVAFDTDPVAVVAAKANALRNRVSDKTWFFQGSLGAVAKSQWHLVLVNILAPVIISLLTQGDLMDYVAEGGRLILGGIVEDQSEAVERAIQENAGAVVRKVQEQDWITLVVRAK